MTMASDCSTREYISSPRAFPATVTTRLAISELRLAPARRQLACFGGDGQIQPSSHARCAAAWRELTPSFDMADDR